MSRRFYFPDQETGGTPETPEGDSTEQQLVEILKDGEVEKLTLDQVKADAQRWRSQGPKIQSKLDKLQSEYEALKEQSAGAMEFVGDFEKVLIGGPEGREALGKIAGALGWTEAQLEEAIKGEIVDDASEGGDDVEEEYAATRTVKKSTTSPPTRLSWDNLDPEIAKLLKSLQQDRYRQIQRDVFEELGGYLENEKYLGKLMAGDDRKAGLIRRLGQQALQRRVAMERQAPGPTTFKEVAQEVRDYLEGFGIQEAKDEPKSASAFGLGEAEFASLGEELHQEQPPKRVPVTSGDYRGHILKRLAHKIVKAGGLTVEDVEE